MLKDFISSIFKISEYERLKKNPLWKALLYLLIISSISGIFISGSIQRSFMNILLMIPENYDTKVPNFVIEDGRMRLDNGAGTVIEEDGVVLIFDDLGNIDEAELDKYNQGVAFFADRFVIKLSARSKIVRYWKDLNIDGTSKETVRQYLGIVPSLLLLLIAFIIIGLIFMNIGFCLVVALLFFIIKYLWRKKLNYLEIFKMTAYSLTLPLVMLVVMSIVFGVGLQLNQYFYPYYISPVYLIISIGRGELPKDNENKIEKANTKKSKKKK